MNGVGRAAGGVAVLWFRACLALSPASFRRRYGREVVEDFQTALGARAGLGAVAVGVFVARAGIDMIVQGLRERFRSGRVPSGHGARPPSRTSHAMDGVGSDVRFAIRALLRDRAFALGAVTVLALGIGANAAVFSALRVAVLAPPPFPEPERLVVADLTIQGSADVPPEPLVWSFPKFMELLQHRPAAIEAVAGYANRSATLTGGGPAEVVGLEVVTPGYFDLVGRTTFLGRTFAPEEMAAGSDALVVVISSEVWRTRFAGSRDVLGQEVWLNGQPLHVIGVAEDGFDGITGGARLWIPMGAVASVFSPFMIEGAGAHWFHVLGRLAPGATAEEAAAQMVAVGDAISEVFPPPNASRRFSGSARSLLEVRSNEAARAAVTFLSLAAGLVLLVACANLSGLMLARARRRAGDGVIRAAIGASRWRLVRASMIESLLLASTGGLAGVVLAAGGTRVMAAAWPGSFLSGGDGALRATRPESLGVDPAVLTFAFVLTLASTVVFGLVPALGASNTKLGAGLRKGGGATRRRDRVFGMDAASLLVGVQIAMALVLMIGVGLVGGSTLRLLDVDEGFRTDRLLTFRYSMPTTNARAADPIGLHDDFLNEVRRLGGVESATFGCAPMRGHCIITRVDAVLGEPEIPPGEGIEIGARMVDDGHFAALGIPVLRGRAFDARDGMDTSPTVIINDAAARALFPEGGALGRSITLGVGSRDKEAMAEIVGVVGDVLYNRPDEGIIPEAYFSYREYPENFAQITVRAVGDPMELVPEVRKALERVDPTLAMYGVETMDDIIAASVGDRRTTLALLGVFAFITILLAGTGTWSIVAYSVADRRREIGLRLALGSERAGVIGVVVREGIRTALFGVGAGLGLGLATSRVVERLLWETEPTDPVVYLGGAAILFVLVVIASWLPARRAAGIDPVEALKGAG